MSILFFNFSKLFKFKVLNHAYKLPRNYNCDQRIAYFMHFYISKRQRKNYYIARKINPLNFNYLQKLFKDGFSTGHGYLREPNDIASYSALACIAIQSNQNDQHGGQSIPSFDYALADGVRKTFAKKYRENLAKSLEFSINDKEGITLKVYEVNKELASRLQLRPEIDNANAYEAEETRLLSGFIELSLLKKAQKFPIYHKIIL